MIKHKNINAGTNLKNNLSSPELELPDMKPFVIVAYKELAPPKRTEMTIKPNNATKLYSNHP
jgi:hypothetical protein